MSESSATLLFPASEQLNLPADAGEDVDPHDLHGSILLTEGASIEVPTDCAVPEGIRIAEIASFGVDADEVRIAFCSPDGIEGVEPGLVAASMLRDPQTGKYQLTGKVLPLVPGQAFTLGREGNSLAEGAEVAPSRNPEAGIVVSNVLLFGRPLGETVSYNHLTFGRTEAGDVYITDRNSTNGTRLARGLRQDGSEAPSAPADELFSVVEHVEPAAQLVETPIEPLQDLMARASGIVEHAGQYLSGVEAAQVQDATQIGGVQDQLRTLIRQVSRAASDGPWAGNYLRGHQTLRMQAETVLKDLETTAQRLQARDNEYAQVRADVRTFNVGSVAEDENRAVLSADMTELASAIAPIHDGSERYGLLWRMVGMAQNALHDPHVSVDDFHRGLNALVAQLDGFVADGRVDAARANIARERLEVVSQHIAGFLKPKE